MSSVFQKPDLDSEFPEFERYELREGLPYRFDLNRREFVQLLGAGLLVSLALPSALAQRSRGRGDVGAADRLHLAPDGTITVLTSKVEVGQGSRTQIAQAAAEELHAPLASIRVLMADSAVVPDDGGTAGSRTTPSTIPSVRKGCAAARQLLLETAAKTFSVPIDELTVKDGHIEGLPENHTFGYAQMAAPDHAAVLRQEVVDGVQVTPVSSWKVLGTSVPKRQAKDIVTGRHQYPSDIRRPNMLYGAVLRPPSFGAELETADLGAVHGMEGIVTVRDGNFVGVAAPTSWAARHARDELARHATWKQPPQPNSETLAAHLREQADNERPRRRDDGDPEKAFAEAATIHRASYFVPYIQHAPMEPRAAVAEWKDRRLTVWTGTQQPSRVQGQLAEAFGLSRDQVRLIVPDTGGGFGGKHTGEAALEAARLAKEAGRPVSLLWSREEEFTWAYFRPAGVMDMSAVLDNAGRITGWEHININSGGSSIEAPYDFPHARTESKSSRQPLRSGSYRALAATANTFARESFMDELAAQAKADPLVFRLRHLTHERLRPVLEAVAERFGWQERWQSDPKESHHGLGLACGTEKGSYVATCAEVAVDPESGIYRVVRICQAFECGAIMNPDNLRAQNEGSVLQGLGAVLGEEIRFKDGRVLNPRFSQYRVPRLKDMPPLEIVLLDRPDLASVGGSETPIITVAPAVANALQHATKMRFRSLPLRNETYRPA